MGRIRNIKDAPELIKKFNLLISEPKTKYFDNKNPINLEIGAGKGDFIIANAIKYPEINFIALEKEATIILKALRKAENLVVKPKNLLFVNTDANNLLEWFKNVKINTIYLNFSDPWPRRRHANNRLTSPRFLEIYDKLLVKNGTIEFKTDNEELYKYSYEVFEKSKFNITYNTSDLYLDTNALINNIATEYEKKFVAMNKKIHKIILSK